MTSAPMLEMRRISKRYGNTQALDQVSFSAVAGEVHAISGENGAGKSTLMKVLSGAVQCDSGEILLAGKPVTISSPHDAHELSIHTVYQEFSLVGHLSVSENIMMGRMPHAPRTGLIDWPQTHHHARAVLAEIGFDSFDVKQKVSRLSVPHQQMVELAKAIVEKPRILILDEPSAVLSQNDLSLLMDLIRRLRDEGLLVLYISHRLDEVFTIADRITVLKDGVLVDTLSSAQATEDQLITLMVGRTLDEIYPERAPSEQPDLLTVHSLTREPSLHDISFSVRRGEIVGMFGLVGSGRSELAHCLFGAEPIDQGALLLNGAPFAPKSPRHAVEAGVALLTEDRKKTGLVLTTTVRDNASLAAFSKMSRAGLIDRQEQERLVKGKIDELKIQPTEIDKLVHQLSGGNQQKVVFAKWMLVNANLIILDEPTRGIDVATKVEIYQIMHRLTQSGIGFLLISSEMLEILGMSDRILVMRQGRLVGELNRADATEEKLLALAMVGRQEHSKINGVQEQHGNLLEDR
ncbi:sugar ABC transporter ATP-binding protein [Aggregatilinea lenta]|uniref:sugar ABC transporter ATP-binding protein n=1 Tax=Aggregatilinea lenta TaxID=913108 RepID=UPI001EE8FF4C|nr:sugar ABC transporter ATP-binding protein [Aggregatilinea lenta]